MKYLYNLIATCTYVFNSDSKGQLFYHTALKEVALCRI